MDERDWKVYINDISKCVNKIIQYTSEFDYEKFINDERTYDAVLRNIEIMEKQ